MTKKDICPKGELLWVEYRDEQSCCKYIITSKEGRDWYYVYRIAEGKPVKLGKAKSPKELEEQWVKM